jgi:DDE family transposase
MKVSRLFKYIPVKELEFLAKETKVDYQVKKLTGISLFRLLLYSMINNQKNSLRVMEHFYNSIAFRTFAKTGNKTTKFNSISDRIATINSEYFERIFCTLFDRFSALLGEKYSLIRFDSTMIAVSSSLVSWGMKVGSKTNKKQLKFTIGMMGSLPCHVEIFKSKEALSEDKTIPIAILNYKPKSENIVVFDRGVHKRKTFKNFTDKEIRFVTRINTDATYKKESEYKIIKKPKMSSVTVNSDYSVLLMDRETNQWILTPFRLIKASIDATGEVIHFLTNIEDLTAYEIAFIYKQRWDIEVFFKFLKQELNLNHIVSRNENGIKVMIYMTLIISILLIAYKKSNKLEGYKIVKLKFANELEKEILKELLILSRKNPLKMKYIFNDS